MRYAISFGNGNDGLSRLHASFTVDAPEGSEFKLAELAMLSQFTKSGRRYARKRIMVGECGENSGQAVILDPARSPGWSEVIGA